MLNISFPTCCVLVMFLKLEPRPKPGLLKASNISHEMKVIGTMDVAIVDKKCIKSRNITVVPALLAQAMPG